MSAFFAHPADWLVLQGKHCVDLLQTSFVKERELIFDFLLVAWRVITWPARDHETQLPHLC